MNNFVYENATRFYFGTDGITHVATELMAAGAMKVMVAFGTRDPFVREFEATIAALEKAGVEVEGVVLQGWPHGFGACGGWIDGYDAFLRRAFDAAQA